jgi:hypothetical protein
VQPPAAAVAVDPIVLLLAEGAAAAVDHRRRVLLAVDAHLLPSRLLAQRQSLPQELVLRRQLPVDDVLEQVRVVEGRGEGQADQPPPALHRNAALHRAVDVAAAGTLETAGQHGRVGFPALEALAALGRFQGLGGEEGEVPEAVDQIGAMSHVGVAEQQAGGVGVPAVGALEETWVVADAAAASEAFPAGVAGEGGI